ncbi:protein crossbronx homolog [Cylas formicarius]|uniref:protein crossbronx homolog n=1 Tax=Cylas formicarius TaxID=197179 RepID=UPI002958A482|nr:protein crossbronx homolog [Cylas formicarius]
MEPESDPGKDDGAQQRRTIRADYPRASFRENDEIGKLYKAVRQEYVILAEYKMVQAENIPGVYVIPSRETPLVWFGVIFVRRGCYEDGVFRFTIILDDDFPDSAHPKVRFQSPIFHPVINPETYELHLLEAFPAWNKSEQHLWQLLKYLYWVFSNVDASVSHGIDKVTSEMFLNDKENFQTRVKELVKASHTVLYDEAPKNDKHYITFESFDPEKHDKRKLFTGFKQRDTGRKGYSWVLPNRLKPLERPPASEDTNEP